MWYALLADILSCYSSAELLITVAVPRGIVRLDIFKNKKRDTELLGRFQLSFRGGDAGNAPVYCIPVW